MLPRVLAKSPSGTRAPPPSAVVLLPGSQSRFSRLLSPRLESLIANPKQALCDGLAPCPETASEILLDVSNPQQAGGEGRTARESKLGYRREPQIPCFPLQKTREAPGGSIPFDLVLPRRALHHVLKDLNHGKPAARGTKDGRCSGHAIPFLLALETPLLMGSVEVHQPLLPRSLSSISNAGIAAAATQIFGDPDCNLKYQTKATLTADVCSWADTNPPEEGLNRETQGTLASPTSPCCLLGRQN